MDIMLIYYVYNNSHGLSQLCIYRCYTYNMTFIGGPRLRNNNNNETTTTTITITQTIMLTLILLVIILTLTILILIHIYIYIYMMMIMIIPLREWSSSPLSCLVYATCVWLVCFSPNGSR